MERNTVDIKENELLKYDEQLLHILLVDRSSGRNIIWATDNYEPLGSEYRFDSEITIESISGENGMVIRPRVNKTRDEQLLRVKEKAEVFTPSWVCNKQNNIIDDAWFGMKNIFNVEKDDGWLTSTRTIPFISKNWKEYVLDVRLEVACGEAPYIASRYDMISGKPIAIENRIGLLDRKLRVVSENTDNERDWGVWANRAFQSIYGFEWQGDNLILARENILYTYIDFFRNQFKKLPSRSEVRNIAEIISWNIWQMDALKAVIPNSCKSKERKTSDLFGYSTITHEVCLGCQNDNIHLHNGIYCKIRDWKENKILNFASMIN